MSRALVIGATRGTGLQIARKLLQQNVNVRIIARNAEKAKRLFGNTAAEIIISDLTAPNEEFYKAFHEVDHIFFTAAVPMGFAGEDKLRQVDYGGVVNALHAAKDAGSTGRFYYMNTIGCTRPSLFMSMLNIIKKNLSHWRIEAENAIRASGLAYTIVRAGVLNNRRAGTKPVMIMAEDIPISFTTMISRADVADVFIACMREPATANKTISVIWGGIKREVSEQLKNLAG